jgi:hypothetical protein
MGCDNKDWLRLDRDNGRQVMEVDTLQYPQRYDSA